MQESTIKRHALLSKDKKYRYSLKRIWDNDKPKVLFIMLNPSLADNYQDDPTIRRLIKFAKLYGYGGFYVGNLFSYITPYPSELLDKDLMFSKKNISEYDIPYYVTDNSKVQKMYKWKPKKTIFHIIQDIYEWMLSNKKILKKYII